MYVFLWVGNERHSGAVVRVQKPRLLCGSRVAVAGDGVPGKGSGELLRSQVLTRVVSSQVTQLLLEPREEEQSAALGQLVKTAACQLNPSYMGQSTFFLEEGFQLNFLVSLP